MNLLPLAHPHSEEPLYARDLNLAQKGAVEALDGPVLVLAGAGTGKTRVLTTRLAHLLATGKAAPGEILALTFTNKAAAEIRERVSSMIGRSVEGWHLGTFHAIAARLLRPFAERVGLKPSFTIVSTDDQQRLIKQILQARNIDDKKSPPRAALAVINRWKDRGLIPSDVAHEKSDLANGQMPQIYKEYQTRLLELNACDFGDLLLHQLTLLKNNPDVLQKYQTRFRYILVDEYQDTNVAQYLWLRLLAQENQNICCVGDEDQSIYGWRGAEIGNILRFEEDFPGAQTFRLEENYRSTGHILGAASAIIAHNNMRLGKTLWTSAEAGEKVRIRAVWDGNEEARFVADEIESLQRQGTSLKDIAIMVRAGFQTRAFEERFIYLGIPYRVLVGARFYERQEIRDAMAYLRLLYSPDDDLAFERIINLPKRGLGPTTTQKLNLFARSQGLSLFEGTDRLCDSDELPPKVRNTLRNFIESFTRWKELLKSLPHAEVAEILLDESGYTTMWQASKSPEAPGRLDNLKELITAIASFETLPAFLEHVSLVLEATEDKTVAQVSIMTLHGAKGLEFPYVFLPGWEEEIFPSRLSLAENGTQGLEEERRLAYVGLTRARKRATISYASQRAMYGSWIAPIPSRFLAELPDEHVERFSSIQNNATTHSSATSWDIPHKKTPPLWDQIKPRHKQTEPKTIQGQARTINAPSQKKKTSSGLGIGDRVYHEKFGNGTIRRLDGNKLEIAFERSGLKKVMDNFVQALK